MTPISKNVRVNKLGDTVKNATIYIIELLTLFRMCISGAAYAFLLPLPKICRTYPTMMKLGTVILYLKKIQKIYESRDTPPEFYCIFTPEISKLCYIKKYRYRLYKSGHNFHDVSKNGDSRSS